MTTIDRPKTNDTTLSLLEHLRDSERIRQSELLSLWRQRHENGCGEVTEFYRLLAARVLSYGEPLLAHDIAAEGLKKAGTDRVLEQMVGLALTRSGAVSAANLHLRRLSAQGGADPTTLLLLGDTWAELGSRSSDPGYRHECLSNAERWYRTAYEDSLSQASLLTRMQAGVNLARVSTILGGDESADDVVAQGKTALQSWGQNSAARYAMFIILGEAALLNASLIEAEDWYSKAFEISNGKFGDLASARARARSLLRYQGKEAGALDHCFVFPRVVTFAGHMIDQLGRAVPRFPPELEPAVRAAIAGELSALGAGYGFASAACGSDILFLEEMLARDGEIHIVLPYHAASFRHTSVDIPSSGNWGERFDDILPRAATIALATEQQTSRSTVTYDFSNMLVEGFARMKASHIGTDCSLLAVWDQSPGDGAGGTASIVNRWMGLQRDLRVVNIADILTRSMPHLSVPKVAKSSNTKAPREEPIEIVAALFADVLHFSRLSEQEIESFTEFFMPSIAKLLRVTKHPPVVKNSWGDGLYFVFKKVEDAGLFALDLRDLINGTDWSPHGLPREMRLRIAIHAGPAYQVRKDAITGQPTFTGSNVNRAARIEPITNPGEIYASEQFVALAAAYEVRTFKWKYVGRMQLAKEAGEAAIYQLERAAT